MFGNIYKAKKVLITGNTGFKGAWLTLWLKLLGAEVYGISGSTNNTPASLSLFAVAGITSMITSYKEDIRNLEGIQKIFQEVKPDFVFHLAALAIVKKAYENPVNCMNTNVIGTVNILEALRLLNNPCIAIMVSSEGCYDTNLEREGGYKETDPLGGKDPYSASKGAAELMIKTYYHSFFANSSLIKIASVRSGNVIGGGDWAANRIVPDCFRAWANNDKVVLRSPRSIRPWQHVLEPLSGYLRTAQLLAASENIEVNGEAFNCGPRTNENHTVLELIEELSKGWDDKTNDKFEIVPADFHESRILKLNIDKALSHLSWKPALTFTETAAFTSSWYNQFYQKNKNGMLAFTDNQIENYISLAEKSHIGWTLS